MLLQRSPHIKRSSEKMFQTTFLTLVTYLLCWRKYAHSSTTIPSGRWHIPYSPPSLSFLISSLPPCFTQNSEAGLGIPVIGTLSFSRTLQADKVVAAARIKIIGLRPLQKSPSPDSRNPNTGFRLFSPLIAPNFTQIPP